MSLNDAVLDYLEVLDTDTGYSSKRLANALDAVRDEVTPAKKAAAPKPAAATASTTAAKKPAKDDEGDDDS
jgi:hypothetical protein